MDTYSFKDAAGYFEEDQFFERQAKNIIEQARQKQQDGDLHCPFIDLQDCTSVEKGILDAYFKRALAQAKIAGGDEHESVQNPPAAQEPVYPGLPGPYLLSLKLNTIQDIRTLMHKDGDIREPTPYDIMHLVLQRVSLANYNGVFYVRSGCVFQQITDDNLRSLVFSVAEPALARGKSPTLLGSVCGLLKDYYAIKVFETTETPDRVFFTNGVYDLTRHELLPPLPTDFVTTYLPFQYNPGDKACPVFDRFLLEISGGRSFSFSLS